MVLGIFFYFLFPLHLIYMNFHFPSLYSLLCLANHIIEIPVIQFSLSVDKEHDTLDPFPPNMTPQKPSHIACLKHSH